MHVVPVAELQSMPSVARRHHFLPQGYLAGFTDTGRKDGVLYVLDVKTRRAFRTSPLNVAVAKDFKRVNIEGRSPDAVETALAQVEDRAVQAIRRVMDSESFPSDGDLNLILNLLSLVIAQNPKARRALNRARSREADEILQWLVSSQATWEHHVARASKAGESLPSDVSYQRARLFVEERRYQIEFENEGTLLKEFEAQDQLLSALAQRTWSVLIASPRGPNFIASDYPYSLAMEHGFRGVPRFVGKNTELFFPLSKTVGFVGVLGTPPKPVVRVPPRAVAVLNRRIFNVVDRQLFLPRSSFLISEGGSVVEVQT